MAIHANLSPRLAAAAVGYGLLLAIVSIPMVYWLGLTIS
jgi:Flp pilus assembly pilin Flp